MLYMLSFHRFVPMTRMHARDTMSSWLAMNTCEKKHSVRFMPGREGDLRNTRMVIKANRLWERMASTAWLRWKKVPMARTASMKLFIPWSMACLPG